MAKSLDDVAGTVMTLVAILIAIMSWAQARLLGPVAGRVLRITEPLYMPVLRVIGRGYDRLNLAYPPPDHEPDDLDVKSH